MRNLGALLLLLLCASALPFELTRSIDRTSLTLGDPLLLKVTAIRKPDEKLIFPGPGASFGDFELKDMRSSEEPRGDKVEETRQYQLTVFKLGSVKIPGLRVVNAKDTADAKVTDSVDIIVKKVNPNDTSDIIDIYGQESVGYGKVFWLTILAVILILALGVYLFDKYVRKRQKPEEKPPEPPVPPEILFEKEIAQLLADSLLEKGLVKEYNLRVSEILRRYLGSRLGFYALESTTTELLAELKKKGLEKDVLRKIESFCEINDPVKFAKWMPPTALSESLVTLAREVAEKTTAHDQALPPENPPSALK